MKKFNKGDLIWWRSQSGGVERTKIGEIIHCLEPKGNPVRELYDLCHIYKAKPMTHSRSDVGPVHETYFVLVRPGHIGGRRIYYPRVKDLHIYN